MQEGESEQENTAPEMDRIRQMVRMKRVLLSGKHLPEIAPIAPSKLNPRDILGEDAANAHDYRNQSTRVQNVFNRLYPATRTLHQTNLRFSEKCSRLEQLIILRDRAWIESAPAVALAGDETVLKMWSVQLKQFVSMRDDAKQRMGADIDDDLSPNLLAFRVECTEAEGLKFKTRRRGTNFSILIKYNDDKLLVESDAELEGLNDVINASIRAAVAVDVMIRENLWLLIDQQLSDVATDLC